MRVGEHNVPLSASAPCPALVPLEPRHPDGAFYAALIGWGGMNLVALLLERRSWFRHSSMSPSTRATCSAFPS